MQAHRSYLLHIGFLLNLLALALFFPGIWLPMFSLDMSVAATLSGSNPLSYEVINRELSILQTVEQLMEDKRVLVAVLIFVFSVCIPVFKTTCVTLAYVFKRKAWSTKLLSFVGAIGKWSMADVFVVAVFLAVLSTNHADTASMQQLSIFGFSLGVEISSQTLSNVGIGFYYFTAYCLVSLAGTHMAIASTKRN